MQKLHTASENTHLTSFLTMDGQELEQIWRTMHAQVKFSARLEQ